jgi:membrane protease YdiL (CAAX protease family)
MTDSLKNDSLKPDQDLQKNDSQEESALKTFFKNNLFGKGNFQRERVSWGPLSAIIVFLVAMFLGAIVYSLVELVYAQITNQDLAEVGTLIPITVMPFILAVPILLTVVGFVFFKEKSFSKIFTSLGFKKISLGKLTTIVLSSIFFIYLFNIILSLIIDVNQDVVKEIEEKQGTAINAILLFFGVCVIVPIYEEVLIRGFLFAGLRKRMVFFPAALISGLFFAVLHFEGSLNNIISIAAAMIFISFVLAWAYEKTNSLWPPIVIHSVMNFTVFLFSFSA